MRVYHELLEVAPAFTVAWYHLGVAAAQKGDNDETIRHRLEVFHAETEPLIAYYGDRVRSVDGSGSIEDIFCRVATELAS